jgi:hypothetical protein
VSYLDEWRALSSRIHGIVKSGDLHARFLAINSSDTYGRSKRLREHCAKALLTLEKFAHSNGGQVPASVVQAVNNFIGRHKTLFTDESGTSDSIDQRVWAALVLLGGIESEISFLLSDTQEAIRNRAERAFAHLQRSIVADPDMRAKWIRAFNEGEVSCEKLGGAQLLAHGIFAFKAHAEGERTDLVFQDVLGNFSDQSYAEGLVLTEWKKAAEGKDIERQFSAARSQANRYASGSLGGIELSQYRYLVVISKDFGPRVPNSTTDGVTYRHINIAVDPSPPSRDKA